MGARLQVHGGAPGHVARERPAGHRRGEELVGERGQDHVGDRRLERVADEPSAQRAGRVLADAVGFHARLLEQPPVDGELTLVGVVRLGELDVVFDRPAFGVLAVEGLVQRDTEAAQHRAPLEPAAGDLLAGAEQGVGVEVDRCGSGSRCARGLRGRGRSAPTPGTGAAGSRSSGRRAPGRRGRACRAARRRGAAAPRTPPADRGLAWCS